MRIALFLLLLPISIASAQDRENRRRDQGPRPRPGVAFFGNNDPAALRFLASVAASDECTGASLAGTRGQALTFTRSSSAYCTKTDGTMVLLTSNQPRLEGNGLLVEEARTNLVLRSDAFDNASWSKTGTAAVTANAGVAPDGTTSAERIQLPTAGAGVQQVVGGTYESLTHAVAVYVKSNTGGSQTFRLKLTHAAVADFFSSNLTATTTWQRFSFSQAFGASVGTGANVGIVMDGSSTAADLLAWGYQFEKGAANSTSYTPTVAASVTRSAEPASFALPAAVTDAAGCASATVTVRSVTSGARVVAFDSAGTPLYLQSTTVARTFDGTNTTSATAGGSILDRSVVLSAGWDASDNTASVINDGVAAAGTYDDTMTGSVLYVGSTSGSSNFLNGHVKALVLSSTKAGCD